MVARCCCCCFSAGENCNVVVKDESNGSSVVLFLSLIDERESCFSGEGSVVAVNIGSVAASADVCVECNVCAVFSSMSESY